MEGRAFWKKQGRTWPLILAVVLSVVLLAAAAYLLLFGYNHFSLELELQDGEQLTLEYGEHYREPGCRAVFRAAATASPVRGVPSEKVTLSRRVKVQDRLSSLAV